MPTRQRSKSVRRLTHEPLEDRRVLAVFTVTNLADAGIGSLREAIQDANALPGADSIEFDAALDGLTIQLTSDELSVEDDLTINAGSLAQGITIDASGADPTPSTADGAGIRIFNVPAANGSSRDLELMNLTLTGGDVAGSGGAVRGFGELDLILRDCSITGNAASNDGGGVYAKVFNYGSVQIFDTSLEGNVAGGDGGGASLYAGSNSFSVIQASTITGNLAAQGGGISSEVYPATIYYASMEVIQSTISENTATGYGGGIFGGGRIANTTILNNHAAGGGGIASLAYRQESLSLESTVVASNTATGQGGGIRAIAIETEVSVVNSRIANNTAGAEGGGVFSLTDLSGGFDISESEVTGNQSQQGAGIYGIVATETNFFNVSTTNITNNVASGDGGGLRLCVFDRTDDARTRIRDSTISYNSAENGGGLDLGSDGGNYCGTQVDILNTTISNNSAAAMGGGVHANVLRAFNNLSIEHSTIAENHAANSGGGVFVSATGVTPEIGHSIVGNNTIGAANTPNDVVGDVTGNYSLFEANTAGGNVAGSNNLFEIDPQLRALGDFGGPTPTHSLMQNSPAKNAGDPSALAGVDDVPVFDQRGTGFSRVAGERIDLGAVEIIDGDFNDDGILNCEDVDALVTAIAGQTHDPAFDMTGDALVDLLDRDAWLAEAGEVNLGPGKTYLIGDATLDGVVDGLDFIEWNIYKFTVNSAWCKGDFNADGVVDGRDFIHWNGQRFQSSDGALRSIIRPFDSLTESNSDMVAPSDNGPPRELEEAASSPTMPPSTNSPPLFALTNRDYLGMGNSSRVSSPSEWHASVKHNWREWLLDSAR